MRITLQTYISYNLGLIIIVGINPFVEIACGEIYINPDKALIILASEEGYLANFS